MKYFLKNSGNFCKALLNTPRVSDQLSLAQWMYGDRQKTQAPTPPSHHSSLGNETLAIHLKRRLKNARKVHENGPKLLDVSSNPETGCWFKIPIQKMGY